MLTLTFSEEGLLVWETTREEFFIWRKIDFARNLIQQCSETQPWAFIDEW